MTLVIMAAGMGSRYGGLKQIESVGPSGEFIIDYSVYDAIKAGFKKVIFIIKEENYEIFKSTIGKRIENHIEVEYVFQNNDNVPVSIPKERTKPLGTAQAILCCKDIIKENFAIINADDFYGRDAYMKAASFLKSGITGSNFGMVGYRAANTLTANGAVKRGVCSSSNGYLTSLVESKVEEVNDVITASPLNGDASFNVSDDTLVSMNMFLFTKDIFDILNKDIKEYFAKHKDNLNEGEFLIPDVVCKHIAKKDITVKVLDTSSIWYGVTYREDADTVKKALKDLTDNGEYPNKLWN